MEDTFISKSRTEWKHCKFIIILSFDKHVRALAVCCRCRVSNADAVTVTQLSPY